VVRGGSRAGTWGLFVRRGSRIPERVLSPHLVQSAARDGTIPVVIHGNPLGFTKEAADAAIAARLWLPAWSSRVRIVPASDAGGLRFVLVFDPARRTAGDSAACADGFALPLVTVAGETAVLGVFCQANEVLSGAVAVGPAVGGAADPVLGDLLAHVTGRVFAFMFPGRDLASWAGAGYCRRATHAPSNDSSLSIDHGAAVRTSSRSNIT
jgi:hypothetical protein